MVEYDTLLSNLPPAIKAVLEVAVPHLHQAVATAYKDGFQAGIEVGRAKMREAILKAAQDPVEQSLSHQDASVARPLAGSYPRTTSLVASRARRGAVRDSIVKALEAHQAGLTEKELASEMERIDPAVSGRSAGGELRRLKGRLYRQEGGKWFLMDRAKPKGGFFGLEETAEPESPAVSQPQATQEESDAPETAIAA